MARGLGLFLGLFGLLNILIGLRNPSLDMSLWWLDLRGLPDWASHIGLALAAAGLIIYGLKASWSRLRPLWLVTTTGVFAVAVIDAVRYHRLLSSGWLHSGVWLPFSGLVAVALVIVLAGMIRGTVPRAGWGFRALLAATFVASVVVFPGLQVYCFGNSDYRRHADVIVAFGAKAYAGHPSAALADRVRTACALYREGYAPRLIFSGGPGDGGGYEAEAMRDYAITLGVPSAAITLDRNGVSTHATVINTVGMFAPMHARRVIAVSHFYHLPRIKMSYQRAGWDVFTVPVEDPHQPARQFPFMVIRETAAVWAYYLHGA